MENKDIETSLKHLLENISLQHLLESISLHYKWLYSKQGGKRFKSEYHNHWISIQDYCYLLKYISHKCDEYILKKLGFDYYLDNILKQIQLAIPQMKDPFGKIIEYRLKTQNDLISIVDENDTHSLAEYLGKGKKNND